MSIRQRLQKLEQATPTDGGRIKVAWHSIVRRDAEGRLVERPHSAHVMPGPHGPAETLTRHETDRLEPFLRWVMDAVTRIHGQNGLEFEEDLRWQPGPDTHHIE